MDLLFCGHRDINFEEVTDIDFLFSLAYTCSCLMVQRNPKPHMQYQYCLMEL